MSSNVYFIIKGVHINHPPFNITVRHSHMTKLNRGGKLSGVQNKKREREKKKQCIKMRTAVFKWNKKILVSLTYNYFHFTPWSQSTFNVTGWKGKVIIISSFPSISIAQKIKNIAVCLWMGVCFTFERHWRDG